MVGGQGRQDRPRHPSTIAREVATRCHVIAGDVKVGQWDRAVSRWDRSGVLVDESAARLAPCWWDAMTDRHGGRVYVLGGARDIPAELAAARADRAAVRAVVVEQLSQVWPSKEQTPMQALVGRKLDPYVRAHTAHRSAAMFADWYAAGDHDGPDVVALWAVWVEDWERLGACLHRLIELEGNRQQHNSGPRPKRGRLAVGRG